MQNLWSFVKQFGMWMVVGEDKDNKNSNQKKKKKKNTAS